MCVRRGILMAAAFPHRVVRASAGSGKTYQLTNRLLALLASGAAPDAILATTFTRKAAGEILERVLLRLADAAESDDAARALSAALGVPLVRARAAELLDLLCRALPRLGVGTLDAHFARLALAGAAELGLPPAWEPLDENAETALRDDAVRAALAGHGAAGMLALLRLMSKGEAASSVTATLRRAVDAGLALSRVTAADNWRPFDAPPRLAGEVLTAALANLVALPMPEDKTWRKAHDAACAAASALDWPEFLKAGLGKAVAAEAETFGKKAISSDIAAAYRPLVEHARAEVLEDLLAQTAATYQFLEHVDVERSRLLAATGQLGFDDVALRLAAHAARAALAGGAADLHHRADAALAHLLLDEFQDTSALQWQALKPLAEELVAHEDGTSFFCVGDRKQSIYGWRGGSPELFAALPELLPNLEVGGLATSWRSAPAVIEFVNRVFTNLRGNPAFGRAANIEAAAGAWQEAFPLHDTARGELAGAVECSTAAPGEDEDETAACSRAAAARIAAWLAANPHGTAAILTRSNDGVVRAMAELRKLGVPASQEGGNAPTDASAAQILLAAATFADCPGDGPARFLVANTPLGAALGLGPDTPEADARAVASRLRAELLEHGYGATLAGWAGALESHVGPHDRLRLGQVLEAACAYDGRATLRPRDFVRHVERLRVEDPAAARVRVMTVHRAKGLEFDAVALPELDGPLVGQRPALVSWEAEPGGVPVGVLRWAAAELQPALPAAAQAAFARWERRAANEALCLLYVALTRAARDLFVIVVPSAANERSVPASLAGTLRGALGAAAPLAPGTVWHRH